MYTKLAVPVVFILFFYYFFSEADTLSDTEEDIRFKTVYQNESSEEEDDPLIEKLVDLIENDSPMKEIAEVLPHISNLNGFFENWSLLHYAVVANRKDVCEILIQRGADVNRLGEDFHSERTLNYGRTPFTISCSRVSTMAIFKLLLNNGGDVNTTEPISEKNPLIYTVQCIDFYEDAKCSIGTQHEKMEQLLEHGADPLKETSLGLTLLHFFDLYSENAKEEDSALDMISTMVKKYKLDVNAMDGTGLTPVMVACGVLRPRRIEMLLRLGANLNGVLARNGKSVIHMLSECHDPDIVTNYEKRFIECFQVLLNAGLDMHKTSFIGNTILHELCTGALNLHAVKICFKYGSKLEQKNIFGNTSLNSCLLYNDESTEDLEILEQDVKQQLAIAKYLLSMRSDINLKDINGMTPLMTAARKNLLASVSFIIENGGSVNEADKCGRTALHHCILAATKHNNFIAVLNLLLEANINVTKRDHNGHTADYYTVFLDEIRRQKVSQYLTLYDKNSSFKFKNRQWLKFQEEKKRFEDFFTISESSSSSFKKLHFEEKKKLLKDLLYTPGVGTVETIAESTKLQDQINRLMQQFCNALSSSDSHFKYKILSSGSVSEGTKIGLLDEYDYLLVVENLLDFVPREGDDTDTGFVNLRYVGQDKMHFLVTVGYFDTLKFTTYFHKNAFDVLGNLETLKESNMYIITKNYGNEGSPERLQNSASFIIFLKYYSQHFGETDLSIDLVPAFLFPKEWWPKNNKNSSLISVLKNEQNFCALLTKSKSDSLNDLNKLRISTSLIETRIIRSLPSFMRNAYMIMKTLKEISKDDEFGFYRYCMDTYRFKNALLKHAQIHFADPNESKYCGKTNDRDAANKETFNYSKTIDSLKAIIVQSDDTSSRYKALFVTSWT